MFVKNELMVYAPEYDLLCSFFLHPKRGGRMEKLCPQTWQFDESLTVQVLTIKEGYSCLPPAWHPPRIPQRLRGHDLLPVKEKPELQNPGGRKASPAVGYNCTDEDEADLLFRFICLY